MGSQVKAKCSCGIERSIAIGGSRLNFKSIEYFPCLCHDCKDIVEGNLKAKKLKCPNCNSQKLTPYNNKALMGTKDDQVIERSFDNIITNGTYKCPSCNEMNLKFKSGDILWD